jgi:hypothetical protein
MKMKIKLFTLATMLLATTMAIAQGAQSFRFSEVCLVNPNDSCPTSSYLDEYGQQSSWIEIENSSYSTHDLRGCYITNNRKALDPNLSVPERIEMMSIIVSGDSRTNLTAKQRIVLFADGKVNRGTLHTNFCLDPEGENFIALFDGNAKTLIDSLTIPAGTLTSGQSFSLLADDEGNMIWAVTPVEEVTPKAPAVGTGHNNKVAEWKEKDPHGFAMAIISMCIVLGCLALLYVFFHIFGWTLNRMAKLARVKAIRKIHEEAERLATMAKQGRETQGIEYENYVAAISLAMHEYLGGTHDMESGVLTITPHTTSWNNKEDEMLATPLKQQATTNLSNIKNSAE